MRWTEVAVVSLLLLPFSTQAGVYKWVDKEGNVHFGDAPPPAAEEREPVHIIDTNVIRGLRDTAEEAADEAQRASQSSEENRDALERIEQKLEGMEQRQEKIERRQKREAKRRRIERVLDRHERQMDKIYPNRRW